MNDDKLEKEIESTRRTIASDGYPMSIGEITNLYRDGELNIRPEFQRFFRWTDLQKSRLVESILIGIPLPSIFVSQTQDGTWELIDGLQRVSTILELQGELKNSSGGYLEPLRLQGTKYLPALEGRVWESAVGSQCLSRAQRLDIKRSKIDVKIIKRESSSETKYDLFQRLNSYGSRLTSQEMRNALLAAVSTDFLSFVEGLASYPAFVDAVSLSDRLMDEKYDIELTLRFLVLHARPKEYLNNQSLRDFSQVLDDESIGLATAYPAKSNELRSVFEKTFDYIATHGGESLFRRWDGERGEFRGSFLNTAFEVFALGLGFHISQGNDHKKDLLRVSRKFWTDLKKGYATGKSTEARLVQFIPLGRRLLRSR